MLGTKLRNRWRHDCRDAGDTSPWTGEDRTMQEQLSRATQDAKADGSRHQTYMDVFTVSFVIWSQRVLPLPPMSLLSTAFFLSITFFRIASTETLGIGEPND